MTPPEPHETDPGRLDALETRVEAVFDHVKPKLRGWLHAGMTPVALVAGIILFVLAGTTQGKVAAAVFGGTAVLLFGTSAVYHRGTWSPRVGGFLRRFDHSNIFLIIAGTYTPFALGPLAGPWGWALFGLLWTLAAVGVAMKALDRMSHQGWSTALYLAMGWSVLFALGPLVERVATTGLVLLAAGGAAYTLGVAFFALDSRLRYGHFVWHLFVVAGTACHYVAVLGYAI